jgi:Kelch motif
MASSTACTPASLGHAADPVQPPLTSVSSEPLPGTWVTLSPAPTKRTEVAAAAVNGKIYLVGGFAAPSLSTIKSLSITDAVEEYDPSADRWSTKASLPVALHHAGIATIEGHLYVAGGFSKSFLSAWRPVASLYRFDPAQNVWTALAPMPTARGALALVELAGKLLAIGGYDGDRNTGAVELYDPSTNRWTGRAVLPVPRDHLTAAVVHNRVFAIGGRLERDYARNLGVVEAYDVTQDQWRRVTDMPTPRSGITAGVLRDTIYVLGGEAPHGTFQTNEAYEVDQDRWVAMAPMPTGRHGLGSAAIGDHLYVMSGGPKPGGSFSDVNERFTPPLRASQSTGRASGRQVGTIMALLAAFQDAGALPPEGSAEANQLIKALIQFQAAFMKSDAPAVQNLLRQALEEHRTTQVATAIDTFRRHGWTSRTLESVVDYTQTHAIWDEPALTGLEEAFQAYHVDRADLELLIRTVRQARDRLASQGKDLHAVYTARLRQMPGI